MKILVLIVITSCLVSCSKTSVISKKLSGSDSLVIQFNKPQTNFIQSTLNTTEPKAIKKLSGFVDGKSSEAFKCGYDGNLLFYKDGGLVGDVSFNFSGEGCHHFIMDVDGKLTPTKMSNEAADLLKSLSEGKGWY